MCNILACVCAHEGETDTDYSFGTFIKWRWKIRWVLTWFNKEREIPAFIRQGTRQQRPELPTVTPPGMLVNRGCISSAKGTSLQEHIYTSVDLIQQRKGDTSVHQTRDATTETWIAHGNSTLHASKYRLHKFCQRYILTSTYTSADLKKLKNGLWPCHI